MNTIEQDLEQQLRTHYQQEMGEPPSSSALWQDLASHLPAQEQPITRWQRLLQAFSSAGSSVYYTPRRTPARRLVVAGSLVCALLLVFGIVYAAGSLWPGHSLVGGNPSVSSDNADALFMQLLHSSKTPQSIQRLAQTGQLTNVHLAKTTGPYTVTLQKLYADANNIVVGYTIDSTNVDPYSALSAWPTLTVIPGGQTLQVSLAILTNNARSVAVLAYFDAASIQEDPQQLNLRIAIPVGKSTTTFNRATPFQAGKTVEVNQTVTSNGHSLTLDRVVITPSETRTYLITHPDTTLILSGSLSAAGKTYGPWSPPDWPPSTNATNGSLFIAKVYPGYLGFLDNLQNDTGTWTLKVDGSSLLNNSLKVTDTWQFTFAVS